MSPFIGCKFSHLLGQTMNGPLAPRARFQVVPPGSISCFHVSLWNGKQIQEQMECQIYQSCICCYLRVCWFRLISSVCGSIGGWRTALGSRQKPAWSCAVQFGRGHREKEKLKELWLKSKAINVVRTCISALPLISLYSSFFWYDFPFLHSFTFCLISDIIERNISMNPGACTFLLAVRQWISCICLNFLPTVQCPFSVETMYVCIYSMNFVQVLDNVRRA